MDSGYHGYVRFESLVNTEGFQTKPKLHRTDREFESLVNTEGFQTSMFFLYTIL